jgi:hypothetical protein
MGCCARDPTDPVAPCNCCCSGLLAVHNRARHADETGSWVAVISSTHSRIDISTLTPDSRHQERQRRKCGTYFGYLLGRCRTNDHTDVAIRITALRKPSNGQVKRLRAR